MRTIAHIVKPVKVDQQSDLYTAQPITFESMRAAKAFAKGRVNVDLFTTQFEEDSEAVPQDFSVTQNVERSIHSLCDLKKRRKVPVMQDVLDRLYHASDAEFMVYTNADIALMPYFYVAINQYVEDGADALIINRRAIPATYRRVEDLPLMYGELGTHLKGFAIYVFRRAAYPKFKLANSCLGVTPVGKLLAFNVIWHAQNPCELLDANLTFHIGEEKPWSNDDFADHVEFNLGECLTALAEHRLAYGNFYNKPEAYKFVRRIVKKRQFDFATSLENVLEKSRVA